MIAQCMKRCSIYAGECRVCGTSVALLEFCKYDVMPPPDSTDCNEKAAANQDVKKEGA